MPRVHVDLTRPLGKVLLEGDVVDEVGTHGQLVPVGRGIVDRMADSGMVPDLPLDSGPNTLVRYDLHMMEVVVVRVAQKPLKDRLGIAQNSGAVGDQ